MGIFGIIPARYGSTRFPGKPLATIENKPMIQWVVERALEAKSLDRVVVATDHEEIAQVVRNFGGEVVITMPDHQSGTDRCLEAVNKLGVECEIVINIQGDEPFVNPGMIDQLVEVIRREEVEIATLVKSIDSVETLLDPNRVKVVLDRKNRALYFSRSPIPYVKGMDVNQWIEQNLCYKHIGLYGYKVASLREITHMEMSSLEKAESLEQLRWLENGKQIHCAITSFDSPAVDTPEDLEKVRELAASFVEK
jgi:3-deoxy-manno-octulosonate cytidylyltransferase (CMP-KDO synthetase)